MGRKRKRRIKKKKNFMLTCLLLIIVLVAGGIFGTGILKDNIKKPYNLIDKSLISVTIPAGSSTSSISNILADKGVIGSANGFKLYARLEGYDGRLQAGDYVLSPSMNADQILEELLNGKSTTARFTVPEGYTIAQTAKKLSNDGLIDYESFINEAKNGTFDYGFMQFLPEGESRLEGFLFPETYEVYLTANSHDIINKMLSQFDKVFTEEYYLRATELGLSVRDVIIIASIIEREAQIDSDRELISSVIYNRLNTKMALQMCSTVQYILGDPKAVLTTADTKIENPYNTYLNTGLPPGPICSPGKESIHAALYPADTDYIYFVVSPKLDGSHAFSKDYKQFLKDKEAYQKAIQ